MRARRKPKRRRPKVWICVDPGVAATGIAILTPKPRLKLVSTQVLRPPASETWLNRCYWIVDKVRTIVVSQISYHMVESHGVFHTTVHPKTVIMWMEIPSFWGASGRGYTAAASGDLLKLSTLIGMLALDCHRLNATFMEVGVSEWKGQLSKAIVKKRVMEAFGLKKIPNHAADAAGIGLWVAGRM